MPFGNMLSLAVLLALGVTPAPPVPLVAECIAVRPADAKRDATLVFEGTVLRVEALQHPEYATTLEVHRVWKGSVPKQITVYHTDSTAGPHFREGLRRIVFSVRQTPTIRKAVGISSDAPLREVWVSGCSAWASDDSAVRELGPGHPPDSTQAKLLDVLANRWPD